MSFDVNIGRSEPVIKAAAGMNNDGGSSGNTGYMGGGRKKKNEKGSLFNTNASDSFELSAKIPKPDFEYPQEDSWISKLISKLK